MTLCGKTELCIFDHAPAQGVVESAIFSDIHPRTMIDEKSGSIEFEISGNKTEYLDLNDTILYLRLKIRAANGGNLSDKGKVAGNNFFMNSLFSDVTCKLNDVVIEGGDCTYPYKATIADIFNFAEDTKRIQLQPAGFEEDEEKRKSWAEGSKYFEMVGALRLDFFNQPKYLIPGINVNLRFTRKSNSGFSLKTYNSSKPNVLIEQAVLYVRRVRCNPAVQLGHTIGLMSSNAIYPITQTKVITYSIPTGSMSYYKENIFSSLQLPKLVVIGFVKAKAFSGDYSNDPFYFDHFNIQMLTLLRDGQPIPYRDAYHPDFEKELYTREYVMSIIQGTEHLNTNQNNGISLSDFANGRSLFTFNLTPDFCIAGAQQPKDGNLRLDMQFGKALPEAINVIVYGLFDHEIQITRELQIIC